MILDNFSTLAEVEDENSASAMSPVLGFLMRMKQAQIATILVHHSGKSGETYRGSSKLEATFEAVVGLKKTDAAVARHGTAFDLTFTKFRAKRTDAHATTTAWLEEDAEGGALQWRFERAEGDQLNQLVTAVMSGLFGTDKAVAAHLDLSTSTLGRRKSQAMLRKLISSADWEAGMAAGRAFGAPTDLEELTDPEGYPIEPAELVTADF